MFTSIQKPLLIFALAAASLAVQAQTPATTVAATADGSAATLPQVEKREARQQARIAQGAATGSLTPREQHRLQHQQTVIARAETRAEADGQVSAAERRKLHRLQDRAGRNIRRQKHDAQHAASPATVSGSNPAAK